MREDIYRMAEVTRALYLREFRKIAELMEEEARLRGQLAQVEAQVEAANNTLRHGATSMQGMGADILWQAWAARNRGRIERDLAIVNGRKRMAIEDVRLAFARQQAVKALHDDAERQRIETRLKAQYSRLLEGH